MILGLTGPNASGKGEVYSFVVMHHPQFPGYEYPLVAALVELAPLRAVVLWIDVPRERARGPLRAARSTSPTAATGR